MLFTDRLRTIGSEVKAIKESLTFVSQDNKGSYGGYSLERGERKVRRNGPNWNQRVAECAIFMSEVVKGKRPFYHLKEAMTVSDFPNLFGDVLYRQLLGNYKPWPVTYPKWMRMETVNDFRSLHMYALDGGQGQLSKVKEQAQYPEIKFSETPYTVAVAKYGQRYGVSFEMMTNDDLNAFAKRPAMMATAARRTEEYLATSMLCDVNGPHASFFTAGNKNIITGNPSLSLQALQTAMTVLASQVDADGQPILIETINLLVPPALKITAENILHAIQLRIQDPNQPGQFLYTENWMKAAMDLSVLPYIPYIASTANGNTSWFLTANANDQTSRPAFVFAKLRGHEDPELFMKDPDQRTLGGGDAGILQGDFDNDSIDYKLRDFMGAAQIDPKMAVSSNGSGIA